MNVLANLVAVPDSTITEEGLRVNVQYIISCLHGNGAAPINNLMEDAAIVEISCTQVWQWIRHEERILDNGRKVALPLI